MTRLYVLPHAGGAAHGYAPLKRALEPQFDVVCYDLPGHGKRSREAPPATAEAAIRDIAATLAPPDDRPWAIFGHSMGALLAHGLVHALHQGGRRMPEALFVSGTVAPPAREAKAIAHLPKEAFWCEVRNYGGVPDEIMQVEEYRDFFETILRRDFALLEGYRTPAPRPVPVPIVVFFGTDDMDEAQAVSWEWETSRSLETHAFPGGHFFLFDHIDRIAPIIAETLARAPAAAGRRYA